MNSYANKQPLLKLDGVAMKYGSGERAVNALVGIDLEVFSGELVAVMGTSGSGKSTMLNIAGWLVKPTSGEVMIGARWLSQLKAG